MYVFFGWFLLILLVVISMVVGKHIDNRRHRQSSIAEDNLNLEYPKVANIVYKAMPNLERKYIYFQSTCQNDEELEQLESDWMKYIICAAKQLQKNENDKLDFDYWFDENDRWIFTQYNKDYLAKTYNGKHMLNRIK